MGAVCRWGTGETKSTGIAPAILTTLTSSVTRQP